MFCTQCGTRNDDSAAVCVQCGADLRRPSFGSDMSTPPTPQPPQPPAPQTPPPYQGPAIGQVTQPPAPVYPGGAIPQVPNYLVQAILTMICCCLPFGVVSLVYAIQVNSQLAVGNVAGAIDSSNKAKTWAWVAFACGGVIAVGYGLIVGLGMIGSIANRH